MIAVFGGLGLRFVSSSEQVLHPGESVAGEINVEAGGRAAGIATASKRLGSAVSVTGNLGDDPWAREVLSALRQEDIEIHASIRSGSRTSLSTLFLDGSSREGRWIEDCRGGAPLDGNDIHAELLARASVIVYCSGISVEVASRLSERAGTAGKIRICSLNDAGTDETLQAAGLADLVIVNAVAFSGLVRYFHPAGQGDFTGEQIHVLPDSRLHGLCRSTISKPLILTLGGRGCFISDEHGYKMISAYTGIAVTCTAGAGEAFAGAVAAWIDQNTFDIRAAATYGNAAAALSCTRTGVTRSMPTKSEMDQFLGRYRSL